MTGLLRRLLPSRPRETMSDVADPLAEAVGRIAAATSVAAVVTTLAAVARPLVGSDGITLVERIGDQVEYLTEDAISPLWAGQRFPVSLCVSGQALVARAPIFIPDILEDRRVPLNAYLATFVRSMAMVPIGRSAPRFALGAYWQVARPIAPLTIERMTRLADAAAEALERIEGPGDSRQVA